MGYDMEELLPIAAWLTNQFTSGESSSVPYETGRRLMEAVIYSIEESVYNVKGALPTAKEGKGARAAYEKGYAAIIDKVYEAKALYNQLLPEYEELYLDNICYPVLLNAVGCMIADKPVGKLKLFPEDYRVIEAYLKKDSPKEIRLKVQGLICAVVKRAIKGMEADYFLPAGSSYSIRLWKDIRSHFLDTVIA